MASRRTQPASGGRVANAHRRDRTHPVGQARRNERVLVFTLWLLVFSAASQTMIMFPLLPQLGRQLGISEAAGGVLVSVYALVAGCVALVAGPVSDRIGRRRILLAGSGLMACALALHGAATSYAVLLLVRAVAGVAGGILSGAAVSMVGDTFPYERRGWATGWISSGTAVGQVVGIPLGAWLAAWFDFRTPFFLFAATMFVAFGLLWLVAPQRPVGVPTTPLTVANALRSYRQLLARRQVRGATAAFTLMYLSLGLYMIYLPTSLAETHGATASEIAGLFMVGGLASTIAAPAAGRLSDRTGRKGVIVACSIGLSVVMFLSGAGLGGGLLVVYLLFCAAMLLSAARLAPFQALLSAVETTERRGSLLGLTVTLGHVGFAAGGLLGGLAYKPFGYAGSATAAAVGSLAMALLVWRSVAEPASLRAEPSATAADVPSETMAANGGTR